jgi:1,2-diacylglycerol 3-beta-galactosyltransferase
MKKVDFIFFDAGGGHRAAANALKESVERQGKPWRIRLVNLQEVLDPLDVFRKVTGLRLEDVYNLLLKKGWTLGSPQLTRGMQLVIRLYHGPQVRLLEKFWLADPPEMVVSLVPNLNRALGESLRKALPGVPFVTVLTDIADYPPHFWIERQPQYFICGSAKAVEQARALGHDDHHIFRTSGMILHPRFYEPVEIDRSSERRKLGLDPGAPTALVLFGGQGSNVMLEIARRLDRVQLIAICGKNERLAARMRGLRRTAPMHVEGFTREIPYFMKLADCFIGKPGPGSISEALHMGLPVIVERNAWTLPQERYNAVWVVENGEAVSEMLKADRFAAFRAKASAQKNRAVWEIPDILQRIAET